MQRSAGVTIAAFCFFALGHSAPINALPLIEHDIKIAPRPADVVPIVVFGKNSRRSVEEFAAEHKSDASELRRAHAASGLIECGAAHGAGQLTLADDVVTTAAHVLFDEKGVPRAETCIFSIEVEGKPVRVPVDLHSVVAGSTNPYALPAVHDWAVAHLTRPVRGAKPYGLSESIGPNIPVQFVARGHIDWGDGRRLSMENCLFHDQTSVADEGTREFAFDCETGDGASGGAVLMGADQLSLGAILVGWRSNRPFRPVPFSPTHYNFAVSIEGAFKKAVIAAANKAIVAK
jgi:hypothetical protein